MTSLFTEHRVLLTLVVIVLILSGLNPKHHGVWLLEVFPVLIGIPILIRRHDRFPLTPLAYRLMAGHEIILMIGAYYTYAEVPLGRWMQDAFGLTRVAIRRATTTPRGARKAYSDAPRNSAS